MDRTVRRIGFALLLLLSASAFTFLLHGHTLLYGFDYDDYHFIRPYSRGEVLAAFRGPWDAAGIELPYYRPLTIAFYAARFEWLGINSAAHHALSLALFSVAATMAGWIVFRLTSSGTAGWLATVFFVAHPAMQYSLVAWVTNQMHLVESIVVLAALIWWDAVHRRSIGWWLPLLGFGAVAFLIKEDGIMLLPVIVVLHAIRRRLGDRDIPPAPRAFVGLAAVLVLGLLGIRGRALAGAFIPRLPRPAVALSNYLRGLDGVLRLVPADRRWQTAASWFVTLVPIAAMVSWRRVPGETRVALAGGVAIAVLFDLPFVLLTKAEQLHLVSFGAVMLLSGSCAALLAAMPFPAARSGLALTYLAGLACMAAVSRDIARDFEPYSPIVLSHDAIVRTWGAVPVDIREYLARKRDRGARESLSPDPSVALDLVTFGVHGPERSPDGVAYQWMAGPRAEMLIAARTRTVTIPLRHAIEAFREPARVRITSDGRVVEDMVLATSEWRMSTTAVRQSDLSPRQRMHRVIIAIDHAWRPADVIPGSKDGRILGLQIGEVQLR